MAISLKNHEDRIVALENNQAVSSGDTLWQPCTEIKIKAFDGLSPWARYRIKNGVLYVESTGRLEDGYGILFRIPNWKYGAFEFYSAAGYGDKNGNYECKKFAIDESGYIKIPSVFGSQWPVLQGLMVTPLTIYYIVRYNIYKLVMFLSHLDTKFGGERR